MIAIYTLVAIIICMFLLDTFVLVPKDVKRFTKEHLLDGDKAGALTKALKLSYPKIKQGQIWRLFSQVFLHVGIPHIVFNCLAIIIVGFALESAIGWQKTILGFFFSALFSGLIMAFGLKFEDGEGASTGIYGLIAMYIMVAIYERNLLFSILPWYVVALLGIFTVVGMLGDRINRWEHATGFAGGLLFSIFALYLL